MNTEKDNVSKKGIFRTTTKLVGVLCLMASCGGSSQAKDPSNSVVIQEPSQVQSTANNNIVESELGSSLDFDILPLDNSGLLEEVAVLKYFLESPDENQCLLNFSLKNVGERCLLDFVAGKVILKNREESEQLVKASFSQPFGTETGNGLELGSGEIMSLEVPLRSKSAMDCSLAQSVNINVSCVNASRLGS